MKVAKALLGAISMVFLFYGLIQWMVAFTLWRWLPLNEWEPFFRFWLFLMELTIFGLTFAAGFNSDEGGKHG